MDANRVYASPSKSFFVSMLTRDIELHDAILDLIDNCLDGIHRQNHQAPSSPTTPYRDYYAQITISASEFVIEDNCGGIPEGLARNSAFRMGRPSDVDASHYATGTIGMYGIGMKRAIFKLGRRASIQSRTATDGFEVTIEPAWLDNSSEWYLPYRNDPEVLPRTGTKITVSELHNDVAKQFRSKGSDFPDKLMAHISEAYSLIIAKGFSVTVNGTTIPARKFAFLDTDAHPASQKSESEAIRPYVLKGSIEDVGVEMYAGFYKNPLSEEELDDELEIKSSADNAGWTIACNDRIVVFRDKSRLTGWGESSVPSFHNQFINFAGIVLLSAKDTSLLPLTTTKRGLDTSSDIFLQAKNYMREATSTFTQFTNRWKTWPEDRDEVFQKASPIPLDAMRQRYEEGNRPNSLRAVRGHSGLKRQLPTLPKPIVERSDDLKTISFKRSAKEIMVVGEFLLGDGNAIPSEAGMAAFDRALRQSRGEAG